MINALILISLQAGSAESEGGLFDFNATLPLMAVQVLFLTVILNFLFYTPIGEVLDRRHDYIRTQLAQASEVLTKAEKVTTQYEIKLAKERKEAQSFIAAAQKMAQNVVAIELTQVQKDTEKLVAEANNKLNLQKEETLRSLKKQVNTLSCHIKNKLVGNQLVS
uniref:ATP synthase CF0 subunit II n=1 Tax=Cryptomonas sp. SAG 977-2f TaxID=279061 RepID=A0A679CAJ6_9CRYP|nr:ATP synthase CF0 subunit II [Cryptomonas sp. SAG 977-2f]